MKKELDNLIPKVSIRKFVCVIIDLLKNAKADKIVLIDVNGKSNLTDYLVICQGNSQPHCRSIAENIEFNLKKNGHNSLGMEGESEGNWVLLDYGEIILHIFHPEIRKYFNIEELYTNQLWLDSQENKDPLKI